MDTAIISSFVSVVFQTPPRYNVLLITVVVGSVTQTALYCVS